MITLLVFVEGEGLELGLEERMSVHRSICMLSCTTLSGHEGNLYVLQFTVAAPDRQPPSSR